MGKWWFNGIWWDLMGFILWCHQTWLENTLWMEVFYRKITDEWVLMWFNGKITDFYGPFSSTPCLIRGGYEILGCHVGAWTDCFGTGWALCLSSLGPVPRPMAGVSVNYVVRCLKDSKSRILNCSWHEYSHWKMFKSRLVHGMVIASQSMWISINFESICKLEKCMCWKKVWNNDYNGQVPVIRTILVTNHWLHCTLY